MSFFWVTPSEIIVATLLCRTGMYIGALNLGQAAMMFRIVSFSVLCYIELYLFAIYHKNVITYIQVC